MTFPMKAAMVYLATAIFLVLIPMQLAIDYDIGTSAFYILCIIVAKIISNMIINEILDSNEVK